VLTTFNTVNELLQFSKEKNINELLKLNPNIGKRNDETETSKLKKQSLDIS